MIHIDRLPRPSQLTDEIVRRLTKKYKDDKTPVWNKPYIKDTLLEMTHYKCCYCEAPLDERSGYMEVEHFHPKSIYPDEVVEWDNLLPVCSTCNRHKSRYDTRKSDFVNPSLVNPKDYFMTRNYRYEPKNNVGKITRDVLDLNSIDKLVIKRVKVGNELLEKMRKLSESVNDHREKQDKLIVDISELEDLLGLVQSDKNYSAIIASVLIHDENYQDVKKTLENGGYWNTELISLEAKAKDIAFDEVNVSG